MQSEIVAMLVPENCLSGTLLVRRADGGFSFQRIDARVAAAVRVAAACRSRSAGSHDPGRNLS
jgi:hypothetical protein